MAAKLDIRKLIMTVVMAVIGIIFLTPFIWMISASLKVEGEVLTYPIQWIPKTWNAIENYREVWTGSMPFLLLYWNSIKVTVLTTLTSICVSSLAAYGFSKINFKGRDALFIIVLATYMIPPQTLLVTQFLLYKWFNLYDTHTGLILLNSFSVFGTFMLRQFYLGIDRKSTRLNSSHVAISYAVFCLNEKITHSIITSAKIQAE